MSYRHSRPAFVATTGGHLVELNLLAHLLEPDRHADAVWITHQTPQAESILADRRVAYVPPLDARDWRAVLRLSPRVLATLRRENVDIVYSTGAALALTALPGARLVGGRARYIESLARPDEPSLAGKVLQRLPWVQVYTQFPDQVTRRWQYDGSLLDVFASEKPSTLVNETVRRIFVTLGTTRPWGFRRLLDRVLAIAPADAEIVWQTGATDVVGLPIESIPMLSDEAFQQQIAQADVIVSHAGVGTLIRCLEAGKLPILVPRRPAFDEHVDDHQAQIARVAAQRGLALMREADDLSVEDFKLALSRRVVRVGQLSSDPNSN